MRTKTDYIVIHCSATTPDQNIGAKEIGDLHASPKGTMVPWNGTTMPAFGWDDIGYHFVIKRDGHLEYGREVDAIGAHARGYNDRSVAICMVGGLGDLLTPQANFTRAQWRVLETLVTKLVKRYPAARVLGHRDLPGVLKACPSFDVPPWWLG